jgi:hypothetical protein
MNDPFDFTYEEMERIAFPGNDLDGAVGKVEAIVFAYEGWPCDLLYLKLTEGDHAGKTIRVLANRCVKVQ